MNGAIATGCPADKKEVIITAEQDHVTKITEDNPDAFWDLIHQAKTACGQDMKAMEHFLIDRLISMGPESAMVFHKCVYIYIRDWQTNMGFGTQPALSRSAVVLTKDLWIFSHG